MAGTQFPNDSVLKRRDKLKLQNHLQKAAENQIWTDEITIWPRNSDYPIHVRAGCASDESLHLVVGAYSEAQQIVPHHIKGDPETHPTYTEEEIQRMKPTYLHEVLSNTGLITELYDATSSVCGVATIELTELINGNEIDFVCMWVGEQNVVHDATSSVCGHFCAEIDISGIEFPRG